MEDMALALKMTYLVYRRRSPEEPSPEALQVALELQAVALRLSTRTARLPDLYRGLWVLFLYLCETADRETFTGDRA